MDVHDVLKVKGDKVVSIGPDATVGALSRLLTDRNIGVVVVTAGDSNVVGIVSERDVIRGVGSRGEGVSALKVEALMTRDVVTCQLHDSLDAVLGVMTSRRVRHLPVMDGGRLCGFITMGDVLKFLWQEAKLEDDACRAYVSGVGYH